MRKEVTFYCSLKNASAAMGSFARVYSQQFRGHDVLILTRCQLLKSPPGETQNLRFGTPMGTVFNPPATFNPPVGFSLPPPQFLPFHFFTLPPFFYPPAIFLPSNFLLSRQFLLVAIFYPSAIFYFSVILDPPAIFDPSTKNKAHMTPKLITKHDTKVRKTTTLRIYTSHLHLNCP